MEWRRSNQYNYQGRTYLEVPFLFNQNTLIHFKESSGYTEFRFVFRNLPGEELEAAIRSTSYGQVIQEKEGEKSGGVVKSYFLLNGEKSTLWMKRNEKEGFIKAKRIESKEATKLKDDIGSLLGRFCGTFSFTDFWVICSGGYATYCETYSHKSYYTFCESESGERYEDEVEEWPTGEGGGGNAPNPEPQPDPCATSQAQSAKTLATNSQFKNAKNQIQTAASDGFEHGISFGKDNNGNIIKSTMSTGNETSGTIPSISNKFADIHNHRDISPPSPGDVYTFIDALTNQPNFTTRYVIASSDDVYALVVTDRQAAINFNNNYPRIRFKDANGNLLPPDFPLEISDKIDDVKGYLFLNGDYSNLQRDESSLAVVLQQYNTGLSLLKMDPEGSFKKIKTNVEMTNGSPAYIINNCL